MACKVKIAEKYYDVVGLTEDQKQNGMDEADFYAWLANGGLQLLANDKKISIPGYNIVNNKFLESLGIGKKVRQYLTNTVKQINAMLYKAEEDGVKSGIELTEIKISELQKAAKKFLKESGIKDSTKILNAIAKLRNEVQLAKLLTLIDEKGDLDARLNQVEKIDKKLAKIQEMRKSTKRLTTTNRKYIRELELPSSYEVSDLEGYGKLLDAYIAARTGNKATTDVEAAIDDFVEGEKAYIDAYKEQINNVKELIKYAKWAEEFKKLKDEGAFEGSDIKTEEDWLKLKERLADASAEEAELIADQKKLDAILEKADKKEKLIKGTIKNIEEFIADNEQELQDNFEAHSTAENPVSFADIEAIDLTKLSYNELVLLNNILQNIAYSGDFTGVGQFTSIGRLSQKSQSLFDKLAAKIGRTLNGLKVSDKRTITQTITQITNGGQTANAALDFILGSWNGMTGRLRGQFNNFFSEYEDLKNNISKDTKELFKATTRIDTYAFINQWFKSDSVEAQVTHVKQRVERLAGQLAEDYEKNSRGKNPTVEDKLDIEANEEGLKALASFGVISDLEFKNGKATYKLVEDINLDTLKGKLTDKEQKLYDFTINAFKALLPDFKLGVGNNLGKEFDEIENYFPTFTNKTISETASPLDLGSSYAPVSKTKSNTKDRSRTLAPSTFKYKTGLTDNFQKGLWMTLMTAGGSNEMADMSNMLNTKWGLDRLQEGGLSEKAIKIIKEQLAEKVKSDMLYGSSSPDVENAVKNELGKLLNNTAVGFILKDWTQVMKQGVAPILTSFTFNPVITSMVMRMSNDKNVNSAISYLISNTSVQDRLISYLQSPTATGVSIEKLRGGKAKTVKAIRGVVSFQDYISDVVTPVFKAAKAVPVLKSIAISSKYSSLLEGVDAYTSMVNITVGYIKNRQRQNPDLTFQDIIDELNAGKVDGQSIQAAERYQADMNAPSNQNDVAKVLKNDKSKMIWFMKGFPLATHQSFKAAAGKLANSWFKNRKDLTPDEIKDLRNTVWRYAVQQTLYRSVTSFALTAVASAISELLGGDDDDEYEWEKRGWSFGGGLFSDMLLGSYSVGVDIVFALAMNLWYKDWADDKLAQEKETDPNFESKALSTPLMLDPKYGGAVGVFTGMYDRTINSYNKEYQLAVKDNVEYAGTKSAGYAFLREVAPFLTGSGTVRWVASKVNAANRQELKKTMTVYEEIATKWGFQYHLSDEDMKSVLADFKNTKTSDMKKRMFKVEEDGNANLYIVSQKVIDEYRKEAILDLYGLDKEGYSAIIATQDFKDKIEDAKLTDAQKVKEAEKQIKNKTEELVKKDLQNEDNGIKKYVLK